MVVTRKKKATKRRNPCLPCNPNTRATRFSRMKRNPDETESLKRVVESLSNSIKYHILKGKLDQLSLEDLQVIRDKLYQVYNTITFDIPEL